MAHQPTPEFRAEAVRVALNHLDRPLNCSSSETTLELCG